MEDYKIVFLPEAYKDLDEIFDYILMDSPTNAQSMLGRIITSLDKLKVFPLSGKMLVHPSFNYYHFRMIVISPYLAFYRFIDDRVYIYRVLHGASDYIKILDQLDGVRLE